MRAEFVDDSGNERFKLHAGRCPFCGDKSLFLLVTNIYVETVEYCDEDGHQGVRRAYGVLQGQCCNQCIWGIVLIDFEIGPGGNEHLIGIHYEKHFPLAKPQNDYEGGVVPQEVAEDILEAEKCYGAEAYKAAVAMCRKALESSCGQFKAKGRNLEDKINDLAKRTVITSSAVIDMAHKIRLGGNRGVHSKQVTIDQAYARALIEFTRQYIDAVYVMPHKSRIFNVDGQASS